MTDANPECTVLSIDGVGAYDHVLRSSFLSKLHSVPSHQGLLLFVRSIYAQTTTCVWEDGTRVRHWIQQAEGGEQGDPLMPLLFSLGIHDSLCEVRNRLRPDDTLFAYLDDVYVSSPPNRTRDGYNLLEQQLLAGAGIQLHTGKTRVWNRAGTCSPGVEDLGQDVWSPDGIKFLGTPIGSPEFVHSFIERRLEDEGRLLGGSDVGPRSPKRVADSSAVCWATLPPPASHTAPESFHRICFPPRRRHVAGHGSAFGRTHGHGGRSGDSTTSGNTANASRRPRAQECSTDGARSVLGVMGRRPSDDP